MAIVRLDTPSDATWQRAWSVANAAERATLIATYLSPLGPKRGDIIYQVDTTTYYIVVTANVLQQISGTVGTGDVVGPASAVDNDIVTFDGTTGKLIKDSGIIITDVDRLGTAQTITAQKTFTAVRGVKLERNQPALELWDASQAADARSILISNGFADPLALDISASDDAHSVFLNLFQIFRNGLVFLPNGQLGFPATQNPSAGANVLDDYEEGDFTTALTFGGLSTGITYSANTLTYTKIGRQVCLGGLINLTSKGSATGGAAFTLPFPVASGNKFASANGMNFTSFAVTVNNIIASCINGTSTAFFFTTAAGATTQLTDAEFTNTSVMVIQVNYFTDT